MNEPQPPMPEIKTERPAMVRPWLLIVFLIVLLAGGGLLGWNFWNKPKTTTATPEVTNTIKTFENEAFGYSIKYTNDWSPSSDQKDYGYVGEPNRLSWIGFSNSAKYGVASIAIEVLKNSYTDVADWATKMNINDLGETYVVKETTVAGIAAKELSTPGDSGAVRTGVIKGGNLYVIHLLYPGNQKDKTVLDSIYKQMLSTFQFSQ